MTGVSAACLSPEVVRAELAKLQRSTVEDSLTPDGPLPEALVGSTYIGTVGETAWALRVFFSRNCLQSAFVDVTEKN